MGPAQIPPAKTCEKADPLTLDSEGSTGNGIFLRLRLVRTRMTQNPCGNLKKLADRCPRIRWNIGGCCRDSDSPNDHILVHATVMFRLKFKFLQLQKCTSITVVFKKTCRIMPQFYQDSWPYH